MLTRHTWHRITEVDSLSLLLLVALLARLAITPLFYDDYNYWAFGVVTSFLLHGQNPFHIVFQDPTLLNINPWRYPPLYFLFTIPAVIAQDATGRAIVYLTVLKTPLAVSDIVSSYYLYKILVRTFPHRTALRFCAMFAFNPLVIFESSGGGFTDPIAITLTVASVYYLLKSRDSQVPETKTLFKSAVLLGLGIATKIYPLLLLPVILRELRGRYRMLSYAACALFPLLVFSVPFLFWDWDSYLQLLTIRNVGGQHPLFPGFELGSLFGVGIFLMLIAALVLVYVSRLSLTSRLTLIFLWVNIAVFSTSFNYMMWGVPFFTLYVAEHKRLFRLPFSPAITLIVALIFQGSYNTVGGSAGFFYWTYHLFHIPLVLSLDVWWLGLFGVLALALSEFVAGYYFLSVLFKTKGSVGHLPGKLTRFLSRRVPGRSMILPLVLLGLVIVSWSFVGLYASFLPHRYPAVDGSQFSFRDSFKSSLLDYQWVFSGQGNYSIFPERSMVRISSPPNGTAVLYRGWGSVVNGFQTSESASVSLMFRLDGYASGSNGMTLINMTDGHLMAFRNNPDFLYQDLVQNTTIPISNADQAWHNFTVQYSETGRVLRLDGSSWALARGSFGRLMLGNSNSRPGFGGSAEFSGVSVDVNDFSTGYQSVLASSIAMIVPATIVLVVLSMLPLKRREAEATA